MRIYLIGMPGCGKSTVAKKLAKKLNYRFCDLDKMIEQESKMSVSEYFAKYGEQQFRLIEQKLLRRTFEYNNVVVATGGGTACFFENINEINTFGCSIYLHANLGIIINRLNAKENSQRPLINQCKSREQQRKYLTDLLTYRSVFYEKASITIEAMKISIDGIIDNLKDY